VRSVWAPRCAALSTIALILCFAVSGSARSLFAFVWVCLALAAMGLEWAARRRDSALRGAPSRSPRRRRTNR
jgi:hypothetical protein